MTAKTKMIRSAVEIIDQMAANDPNYPARLEQTRIIMEIAKLVFDARNKAKMTQTQLANLVGTTQSVISDIEDGDAKGRSLATLTKVALALGINIKLSINPKRRRIGSPAKRGKAKRAAPRKAKTAVSKNGAVAKKAAAKKR